MANWTVSRLGQALQTGSTQALFQNLFSGEVLAAYQNACVTDPLHRTRTIEYGKSASFAAVGTTTSGYHTPGNEIVGAALSHNETVITIDDLLYASAAISNIDEAKASYDVRSPYTTELGNALAQANDSRVLRKMVLAARQTTDYLGTTVTARKVSDAAVHTDADILKAKIIAAAQTLDELNVPKNDRVAILPPALYYLLLTDTDVLNRDWGGSGSLSEGTVPRLSGLGIVMSNNLPTTNIASATTGENNTYHGNFTTTKGVVVQKEAVATVSLLGMSTEMEYSVSRQATLIVSKYARGTGVLRPSCAVEIATS